MKTKFYVENDEFIIENYNNTKAFASFLPSIAGLWGKPLWLFYVNRAQCISSFGTKDKDSAILEFVAANKAWRLTSLQGFRTFLKINNENFYEPFQNKVLENKDIIQKMYITSHTLKITESNPQLGLEFQVEYFTLPNENFSALMRILIIKNISDKEMQIELLDGLPIIIPYGLNNFMLKNISRLAEGWYSGVFFVGKKKIPVYKLLVEPEDRPEIVPVEKANFYFGFLAKDDKIFDVEFVVDPDVIFGPFKDYSIPIEFINMKDFKNNPEYVAKNKTPCGFGHLRFFLGSQQNIFYYSIIGNVQKVEFLENIVSKLNIKYFEKKKNENKQLIQQITNNIYTESAYVEFDEYCKQTFLDNILRGGYPIVLGKGEYQKTYYIYSRIHGDMEREYNNFVIMPEYFSQGNGHYRDVLQNRRNDVFFNPQLKDQQIIYFMNLIQLDGYNPLLLMGSRFKVKNKNLFLKLSSDKEKIKQFVNCEFTLGELFNFVEEHNIKLVYEKEKVLDLLMQCVEKIDNVLPTTGYWSDHWHYNIDLIESFLAIYPEELENLLFNKKVFTFYDNPTVVMPRSEKYVLFHNKPRQLNSLYLHPQKQKIIDERKENKYMVRTEYGKGKIYKTTLIVKLLCLVANKFSLLDCECVGVEMEADRPNWCDALNGLPGLFGSSTAESLELIRLIKFLLKSIDSLNLKDEQKIFLPEELYDFLERLKKITDMYSNDNFKFWDERHNVLENYRKRTIFGISGEEKVFQIKQIKEILNLFLSKIEDGIKKAIDKKTGVIYTYFENEVVKYKILKDKDGKIKRNINGYVCIEPLKFKQKPLPYFLEGPVHYLRISEDKKEAKKIHNEILNSSLYDKKLKMFKINAPLDNVTLDIGRIKVFTSGWLENESIWLHMEYKYLLELLRNNLAEEFWGISKDVLIPFMDPQVYGRSIFENSSFIVSSAHPEKTLHGQGFVGRLSGSTAEFISMWLAITCGLKPFYIENGKLYLKFSPQIPRWMFKERKFKFKFLGKIDVVYINHSNKDTYGENKAKIKKIILYYEDKKEVNINSDVIGPDYSYDIRLGKIKNIIVEMQ
ncbi:MAG: cellobiose phosphorylase [Endomicrobiia bacterium]